MPEVALLRKLKAELSEWSDVQFGGWKTFRNVFVQRSIDALVKMGYTERAAAEAQMPQSRETSPEVVLKHYGRIRTDDAFRFVKDARRQARLAEVRVV